MHIFGHCRQQDGEREIPIITGPEQVKLKVEVKFAWKWEGQSFISFYKFILCEDFANLTLINIFYSIL